MKKLLIKKKRQKKEHLERLLVVWIVKKMYGMYDGVQIILDASLKKGFF